MNTPTSPLSTPSTPSTPSLKLCASAVRRGAELPLPAILRTTARSGAAPVDPLLAGLVVDQVLTLGAGSRGGPPGETALLEATAPRLLALESDDGATLIIRSDTLAEAVARQQPDALVDGVVDLARWRDAGSRQGASGDLPWTAASMLRLPADEVEREARELASQWATESSGEPLTGAASVLGVKALLWTIEARLVGRPGLYRWSGPRLAAGDLCATPGDPRLANAAQGKPMLVLIHGTGSYTAGTFADLHRDPSGWKALADAFPGGIFGFEHRTFCESPVENALALAQALPDGARVALLTHSRGGLIGDLLCVGEVDDNAIDAYRIDARGAPDAAGLERQAQDERRRLRAIGERLRSGNISVQRYVRVAAPARGTRLLSANLDAALSDFLNLLQWGGGALLGVCGAALGGPVAGVDQGRDASSCLGVVKRLLLEIAGRRIDPRLVPGIAAMRIDSPLAAFLAHPLTTRRAGIAMAIIAGDTESDATLAGDGASPTSRIASLFCDWRLFDGKDNDLVVDTDSMYAGLATRPGASYLFDQDATVSHFRYFCNPTTRDALCAYLAGGPDAAAAFAPLADEGTAPWSARDVAVSRQAQRGATAGPRAVAIIVPGIMGSHLEVARKKARLRGSGERIWFNSARLALGELARIADPQARDVAADDLFELIYGELAGHLAQRYAVIRCPYDWRLSPGKCADDLQRCIDQAGRDNPGQPIHLIAHSMGGLVARSLIARHPDAWRRLIGSGGRLIMLGTPNNGAHMMVHTLLGKASSIRLLEKIDLAHPMQELRDIVGGFPGALALLPRPEFVDSGREPRIASADYYRVDTWQSLRQHNRDRWYGDGIGAVPAQALLDDSAAFWNELLPGNEIADPERVCYVFGQSDKTACGVARGADGRLELLFTADGDGWVSWDSGRLDNLDEDTRCWAMPVEHGDLCCSAQHFPAIVDLLEAGATARLPRLPRRRGGSAANFVLDCAPPVLPGEDELARALVGGGSRPHLPARAKPILRVAVRAGDLRFSSHPVVCGHYIGDAISGAEAALDTLLGGALAERERLGAYASDLGSSAIILRATHRDESSELPGGRIGAVIVGLGKFDGQLGARQVTETVRAGVVRFLLQLRDAFLIKPGDPVELDSLLIGWNSTASISVAESVAAVTRGVVEANRQFSDALGKARATGATVSTLCFVEVYRNAAIAAARAVADLPATLASELKRLGARIDPQPTLEIGTGVQDRLGVDGDLGHWSRLMVCDADADEGAAPPPAVAAGSAPGRPPERLKYVLLSPRARAETLVTQRQPGLIEAVINDQRHNPAYDAKLGRLLFQLMVPLDYKALAREQSRLLLVLDGYTSRLPWELLQADDEPLVLRMPMIRQLATRNFRPAQRTASRNSACLIAAPSTAGYDRRFGGPDPELPALPQATSEAQAIADSLRRAGWNESDMVATPPDKDALDILATLYARPYRILVIAAHGVFEATALDGRRHTGVVLSDGLLLGAAEIELMEVVPELVFLNCCHLGNLNDTLGEPNALAYSVSRKLIEIGVRCVVAAGWAVNDAAACTFAATFFGQLTAGDCFGDAVFAARRATFEQHPATNTWGAYQAYGDPGYRLQATSEASSRPRSPRYVALDEVLAAINAQALAVGPRSDDAPPAFAGQRRWVERQLARCPPDWAQRPELLQAIGALYARCADDDGLAAARDAYQRALAGDDGSGRIALRTVEQLATLEIRHGELLAGRDQSDAALESIDCAVARLDALAATLGSATPSMAGAGRAALRQRALEQRAAIVAGSARAKRPGY